MIILSIETFHKYYKRKTFERIREMRCAHNVTRINISIIIRRGTQEISEIYRIE